MERHEVKIELYDKREKSSGVILVEQLAHNSFRMIDNDAFNYRLTLGTEFQTKVNTDGKHEIVKITRESDFITRRFILNSIYKMADYRMLGDELVKRGGFWQVDFGSIVTVNIPKDFAEEVDKVIQGLNIGVMEIVDDEE